MRDPNVDFINCSTHAVQKLFDEFPNGIPSIDLSPLDPLILPRVKVSWNSGFFLFIFLYFFVFFFEFQILQGGNGPVTVNASLTNVTVIGFANAKIVKNSVDPKDYDFHTELKLPRLRIDGNYEMFGKILVIPLQGKGACWFDASKYRKWINEIAFYFTLDLLHTGGWLVGWLVLVGAWYKLTFCFITINCSKFSKLNKMLGNYIIKANVASISFTMFVTKSPLIHYYLTW